MAKRTVTQSWIATLRRLVEAKPCVVLRLNEDESAQLSESKHGFNEFTLARPHAMLSDIQTPTACLIFGAFPGGMREKNAARTRAYVGIVSSRAPVVTLDTRIKVKRAVRIQPDTTAGLVKLLESDPHAGRLRRKLESGSIVVLSPKLSGKLIEALAGIQANHGPLRAVAESLHTPRTYTDFSAVQEDAVQTALKAFGLLASVHAERLELVAGKISALARVPLVEDAAIEFDARSIPGYTLTVPCLTGRAVFTKGTEKLEVITANRRDLEHVFGVDLIYVNLTRKNIVMVQYKMLEPNRRDGEATDWLYRPDGKLAKEIARMKRFSARHTPRLLEYRLNPQVFYLKFVKRNAALSNGSFITPIDHYERLLTDPACKGPRNAVRISYESLNGRYMRQRAFLDLIHSGYIGAYAETTAYLDTLIKAVLNGDRAVVTAVQSPLS